MKRAHPTLPNHEILSPVVCLGPTVPLFFGNSVLMCCLLRLGGSGSDYG